VPVVNYIQADGGTGEGMKLYVCRKKARMKE